MPEKIVLAWSGGKDCAMALAELLGDDRFDVVSLLTTVTSGYDRISMHGVREALLDEQAASVGLPVLKIRLSQNSSNDEYESKMAEAMEGLKKDSVNAVAFGDLFLEDVRAYRERNLARADMRAVFPLWGRDTRALARQLIGDGYRAIITCVDTDQLDERFLARMIDNEFLSELPANVDPCAENGEFHTFAFDGPIFKKPIRFDIGEKVLRDGRFYYCDLLPI